MFENIIGHKEVKEALEDAIINNNVTHAYLFEGIDGIGKKMIAEEFAKKILNVEHLELCPDYKYIEKQEDKKDIVVEQIRNNIVNNVISKPISANKKVYIVNDAQSLNVAAQNVLLKTLEEPPNYVVIILISNQINAFLPTIKSRVKIIKFNSLKREEIENYIYNRKIQNISDVMIDYIDGSLSKLVSINEEVLVIYNNIVNIVDNIDKKNIAETFIECKKINFREGDYLNYLQFIFFYKYKKLKKYEYTECVNIVEKAKQRLKNNGNYDIVVDNMIIQIYNLLRR